MMPNYRGCQWVLAPGWNPEWFPSRSPGEGNDYSKESDTTEWLSTQVFLPGEFHGLRSLVGYSPWGCKESNMTEQFTLSLGFPGGTSGKEPTCQWSREKMRVQSLGQEDPQEKGMITHSTILAWRIPWTEEPGGLQSTGSQRIGSY